MTSTAFLSNRTAIIPVAPVGGLAVAAGLIATASAEDGFVLCVFRRCNCCWVGNRRKYLTWRNWPVRCLMLMLQIRHCCWSTAIRILKCLSIRRTSCMEITNSWDFPSNSKSSTAAHMAGDNSSTTTWSNVSLNI